MRDTQVDQSGQFARIPFVSTALHCVAMTVLVFLRHSFGYLYLRPRSLLLGMGWTATLFAVYSWFQPGMWNHYWAISSYGVAAFSLYLTHFAVSVFQQTRRRAVNDQHSGDSLLLRVLRPLATGNEGHVFKLHLIGEPLVVLGIAVILWIVHVPVLPTWLAFAAVAVAAAEAANYWLTLRREKRQTDMMQEAEEKNEGGGGAVNIPPPKATRQPRRRHSGI